MSYILIMTLYLSTKNPSMSITTAEFSSKEACVYAAAQQEVILRNDFKMQTHKYYTAICVSKGESPNAKTN